MLRDIQTGQDVFIAPYVNAYECTLGDGCKIGAFVEIQRGVVIGKRCKVSSHSFLCTGVTLEDEVFVGHGVMFTNDRFPRATKADGALKETQDWKIEPTIVRRRASIGSNATILPGIEIGEGAMIAAGAVVTKSVAPGQIVAGNPARVMRAVREDEK